MEPWIPPLADPTGESTRVWLIGWAFCLAGAVVLWLWSLYRRDASIVDIWWGIGFVGLVWWYQASAVPALGWQLVHALLITVWGLRLAAHIAARGRGRGEDHRYTAMREGHGRRFWWVSLFTVFGLQASLVAILATPLLAVQRAHRVETNGWLLAGSTLAVAGLILEAVADWQLFSFQRSSERSADGVLDRGLWRYSRHPNYFGEAVLWWGFGLMAVGVGSSWTLYSPIVITLLLLKVSGVSLMEREIDERRPAYADYRRRTSAFVPWPPRPEPRRSEEP